MNKKLWFLFGACLSVLNCLAVPPELAPVPNPGRWTVRLEKAAKAAEPEGERHEVSREIWVLGSNRYEVTTWSDGQQGQIFVTNDIGFEKSAKSGDVYVLDPSIGAPAPPPVAEWREFAWLKPEFLKGKETFQKKACVVYEQQTDSGLLRALIDEESRLPVALQTQGKTYIYEFQKAPDKLPSIDAVLGGARQGYEAALKKLSVDLKPR